MKGKLLALLGALALLAGTASAQFHASLLFQASGVTTVGFNWGYVGGTGPTACPATSPTACASGFNLVDTTGLAAGATLPTANCSSTVQTQCIAAAILFTSGSTAPTSYSYTPLVPINTNTNYNHTFVLVEIGYNSLGQAITSASNTATVSYTPYQLPAINNFQGGLSPAA